MTVWLPYFLDLFKYMLPGLFCLAGVYMVYRFQVVKLEQRHDQEVKMATFAHAFPLRLQAYERLILLLERMHPERLVLRCEPNHKSALALGELMLSELRAEFEHNMVQQLYVSDESWNKVMFARDASLALIEGARKTVGETSSGLELAKFIFRQTAEKGDDFPTVMATKALRNEALALMEP